MKVRGWFAASSLVLLVACGGGAGGGGTTESPTGPADDATQAAATGTLRMVDNAYEPSSLTIDAGQELELVNEGAAPHSFTVEGQEVDHDVAAGETETETIELAPGTYTMFCKYHREQGMEGTVTVR